MKTLALDFGGSGIKAGLIFDGVIAARAELPARAESALASRLDDVAEILRAVCVAEGITPRDCDGIGISYPSIVDSANARVVDHFGKFAGGEGVDFRAWAEEAFGLPVAIENDARAALLGEWRYGPWKDCENLALLAIGTGLGVAAVVEGVLLRGAHGQAAILGGHTTMNLSGRPCVCGNIGCAETEASTSALAALARSRDDFRGSALEREETLDYAALFRLEQLGDPCARELAEHSRRVWSSLAVNLIHLFDPEVLVIGGGVSRRPEAFLPAMRAHVARHAHTPWGRVRIEASRMPNQAALLGCEWLVREQLARAA